MYKDLGMTMESTGGRESTINGKAESPIRTSKATIRAQLIGSSFDNVFWCFAGATGTTVHNNILHIVTSYKADPVEAIYWKVHPSQKTSSIWCKSESFDSSPIGTIIDS
jgi:hypothetical protein